MYLWTWDNKHWLLPQSPHEKEAKRHRPQTVRSWPRPGVDTRSSYKEFTVQSVTKDSIRRNVAEAANMVISPEPYHSLEAQSGTDRNVSAKIGIFTGCSGALASRLVDRGCVADNAWQIWEGGRSISQGKVVTACRWRQVLKGWWKGGGAEKVKSPWLWPPFSSRFICNGKIYQNFFRTHLYCLKDLIYI